MDGPVWLDTAVAEPTLLVAVTATRIVKPRSPKAGTYVRAVAPAIFVQLAPLESQRLHWYENASGTDPDHVPRLVVSPRPGFGLPAIAGRATFAGAAPAVVTTTSSGLAVVSRLEKPSNVLERARSARLTRPLPLTSGVTSSDTHVYCTTGPELATTLVPTAGALAYVIVVSPQLVLATPRMSKPAVTVFFAYTRRVACVTAPARPATLKRR